MKENDKLGHLEQLLIKRKARNDVINKCFKYIEPREDMNQLVKYDEIGLVPVDIQVKVNFITRYIRFFKSIVKEFHSNKTYPYEHMHLVDYDNKNSITYFAISQYVLTETAKFVSKRDSSLSKDKMTVYLFNGKGKRKKKFLRLRKALSLIDSCINELQFQQNNIMNNFCNKQDELKMKHEYAKKNNYLHKVRLYENVLQKIYEEKELELNNLELKINNLKSEKLRILKEKQLELQSKRSRTFLRIRYYYECANGVNPNIGIMLYNEDDLSYYAGLDFEVLNANCMRQLQNIEE